MKVTRMRRAGNGESFPSFYDAREIVQIRHDDRLERWRVQMPDGQVGYGPTVEDATIEATRGARYDGTAPHSVVIMDEAHTYHAEAGDSPADIMVGLVNAINAGSVATARIVDNAIDVDVHAGRGAFVTTVSVSGTVAF